MKIIYNFGVNIIGLPISLIHHITETNTESGKKKQTEKNIEQRKSNKLFRRRM